MRAGMPLELISSRKEANYGELTTYGQVVIRQQQTYSTNDMLELAETRKACLMQLNRLVSLQVCTRSLGEQGTHETLLP